MTTTTKLLLCAVLALSACGEEDDTPPPPPVQPATQPPPVPVPPPPPLPSAVASPPWVELTLPAVPGWEIALPQDHGPGQGFIVDYMHRGTGVSVSIFVYNRGLGTIARDTAALTAEVREATNGVRQAVEVGRYQAMREVQTAITRLGSAPTAPVAAMQTLVITAEGAERPSSIYVTTHRGFFFKIRSTYTNGASPAADLALGELLARLGEHVRE